jgi:hypothetical protein
MLREELQLLQEPGSYVGEVVKVMGKSKVLVKVIFSYPTISISYAYHFLHKSILALWDQLLLTYCHSALSYAAFFIL